MKRGAFVLALVLCLVLACPGEAKKKRRQMPDLEKIGESFVGPSFGAELANMSRAVLKVGNWEEYDRVTDAFRNLLVREASKGTRTIRFAIVNPDRQFNQGADIGRYSDVLQHMLRGKNGEAPELGNDEMMASLTGCVPMRERYCMEKISRASRLNTHIAVENCHRWSQAQNLLGDGVDAGGDMPDVAVDWRKICHECFGQRVQTAVVAFRDQGQECLDISDEESENLAPQFPSNWTIDVSTRTTIGGMRMEERKLLPIGSRWMPLMSVHALALLELVEGGVKAKVVNLDGTEGAEVTPELIRQAFPNTFFNFQVNLW